MQLLKSELGPGSVETDGRTEKNISVIFTKCSAVLIEVCFIATFWIGISFETPGPSSGFDTFRCFCSMFCNMSSRLEISYQLNFFLIYP